MIFGETPLAEAEGAILAHSLVAGTTRLRKGRRLDAADIAALAATGIGAVVAARLEPGDLDEDAAAARVAAALVPDPSAGLTVSAPFTGRVNIHAVAPGVVRVDAALIHRVNAAAEAITVATMADCARVAARQLVATVKIIPYGVGAGPVAAAEAALTGGVALLLRPVMRRDAGLILTRVPGMKERVLEKGAEAVRIRLAALGLRVAGERVTVHETGALAAALVQMPGDMLMVLTGSATSDRLDVGPAALAAAGGRLERFGMPVDPGNLLFLGDLGGRPVIGLPGCARSPRLNGADWVLERLACGVSVTGADIAAMGVGGLLKEIPSRPAPRAGGGATPVKPRISGLLLAAGASRRMRGRDKLLAPVVGGTLIARAARTLAAAQLDEALAVIRPGDSDRAAAVAAAGLRPVENPRAAAGMGTSIAAGMAAIDARADAVLIMLADMPDLAPADLDRLIAGFEPEEGRAILRAVAPDGRPGHPVLIGRRFFEDLARLDGDTGARRVIAEHPDFVTEVVLAGAATDLDTPADWAGWTARAESDLT